MMSDLQRMIGVHSLERSAQEDTLLVLFNTAISNLVGGYLDICMRYHTESTGADRFYSEITSPSAEILPASFSPSSQVLPF